MFFKFGRYINKIKVSQKNIEACRLPVFMLFVVECIIRIVGMNTRTSGKFFGILMQCDKYLIGFAGAYIVLSFARFLSRHKGGRYIKLVGDYSFDIYLMHNLYFVVLVTIVFEQAVRSKSLFDSYCSDTDGDLCSNDCELFGDSSRKVDVNIDDWKIIKKTKI